MTQDADLAALYDELRSYPGVEETSAAVFQPEALVFTKLCLRSSASGADGSDRPELAFFSTLATFGTALDVTVAELAIESFFPADKTTERALRAPVG